MSMIAAEGAKQEQGQRQGQGKGIMPGQPHQPSPSEELFQLLGCMSEDRASVVVSHIRQGHSASDTLLAAREEDPRQQLSLVSSNA